MKTSILPTSITALLQPNLIDEAQAMADELAVLMARLHGGKWRVQLDHSARFVLVVARGK